MLLGFLILGIKAIFVLFTRLGEKEPCRISVIKKGIKNVGRKKHACCQVPTLYKGAYALIIRKSLPLSKNLTDQH